MPPKDTEKPLSLPEFVTLMAFMTSLVALSVDAILPALTQIGVALAVVDPQQLYLTVSLFFFGMSFGQLFFGPLSDAKGRRIVILLGLIVFVIGTLICLFAKTLIVLLIGRMIQAFGAAGPRVASLAVIRDKYEGEAMARVMSFIMVIFILIPMIAPMIGQGIVLFSSWRHIFTFFLIFSLLIGCWFFMRQPETLPLEKRNPLEWAALLMSIKFIFSHRIIMGYTFASGLIFGAFLGYLSASQTIFQHIYDTGDWFPAYFAILALAIGLASFLNGNLVMRAGMKKLCHYALSGFLATSLVLTVVALRYDGLPGLYVFVMILFIAFFMLVYCSVI